MKPVETLTVDSAAIHGTEESCRADSTSGDDDMNTPGLYVQYGAGLCGPASWMNFDVSPTLRLQRVPLLGVVFRGVGPVFPRTVRYGDIVTGLPIRSGACAAMYCSHTLEHLSLQDLRKALANTFAALRPGGRFRLVLPDLETLAKAYLSNEGSDASLTFMRDSGLGKESRTRGLTGMLRSAWGNTAHLWMWDFKGLQRELASIGFRDIRRAECGDSGDAMFDAVEDPRRWDNALGMECFRSERTDSAR